MAADRARLDLAPVRLAPWREVGGRVVLERPRPPERGLRGLLERLSWATGTPRLRLDELGGFAWKRFDGTRTVAGVARELRERFGTAAEPTEDRLVAFLGMLERERLVGWSGPSRPASGPEEVPS